MSAPRPCGTYGFGSIALAPRLYTLLCLLVESLAARRDAPVRFLKAEDRILLRARIPGRRLVLAPGERSRLLSIGHEPGHPR